MRCFLLFLLLALPALAQPSPELEGRYLAELGGEAFDLSLEGDQVVLRMASVGRVYRGDWHPEKMTLLALVTDPDQIARGLPMVVRRQILQRHPRLLFKLELVPVQDGFEAVLYNNLVTWNPTTEKVSGTQLVTGPETWRLRRQPRGWRWKPGGRSSHFSVKVDHPEPPRVTLQSYRNEVELRNAFQDLVTVCDLFLQLKSMGSGLKQLTKAPSGFPQGQREALTELFKQTMSATGDKLSTQIPTDPLELAVVYVRNQAFVGARLQAAAERLNARLRGQGASVVLETDQVKLEWTCREYQVEESGVWVDAGFRLDPGTRKRTLVTHQEQGHVESAEDLEKMVARARNREGYLLPSSPGQEDPHALGLCRHEAPKTGPAVPVATPKPEKEEDSGLMELRSRLRQRRDALNAEISEARSLADETAGRLKRAQADLQKAQDRSEAAIKALEEAEARGEASERFTREAVAAQRPVYQALRERDRLAAEAEQRQDELKVLLEERRILKEELAQLE